MFEKKYLVIAALFIILIICVLQKANLKRKEGFFFKKTRNKRDRKLERLDTLNKNLEKEIEYAKKDLRLDKNKESIGDMLVELHENIGNEIVKGLYYKNKDKSHRHYNQQQEGLNNLAKYLKFKN